MRRQARDFRFPGTDSSFGSAGQSKYVGVRIPDNRQTSRHPGTDVARTMPGLRRGVDDIALVRNEDRDRPYLELVLTLEHEPEFRAR